MYFYFSSKDQVAVRLSGGYFCVLGGDAVRVNLENPKNTLVEILPLNGKHDGIYFLLDDNFLDSPINGVTVTDLKGAYAVSVSLSEKVDEFKVLFQERFNFGLATVFLDGNLKISIDTERESFVESLPIVTSNIKIETLSLYGENFIAVILEKDGYYISVYAVTSTLRRVFDGKFYDYRLSPDFTLIKKYSDIKKHKIELSFIYDGEKFIEKNRRVSHEKEPKNLNQKIIPYAFLEDFLVGDSIDEYLSGNVLENKDKLKDYFGDFLGIAPPKDHRNINEVGLVYKKKENVYYIDYFTFEFDRDKICNLKKCEN